MGIASWNLNRQQNNYSPMYTVGVKTISNIEDPVCEYLTTLFK